MATILGDVKMEGSKVDRHFVVALHMGAECRNRKNVKTLADQHAAKHLLVKRCEKDEQNNVITRHQPVLEIPTMPTEVITGNASWSGPRHESCPRTYLTSS